MNELLKPKIEEIKTNPAAVVINFNNEDLSDDGAALLAEALQGRQVTELYLGNCNITNEGFKALIPVINACTNLTALDLSGQDLDLILLTITSLASLTLSNCKIGMSKYASMQSILSKNTQLKHINLNSNELNWLILNEINRTTCTQLSIRNCNLALESCAVLIRHTRKNPIQDFTNICEGNRFTKTQWDEEVLWQIIQEKGLSSYRLSVEEMKKTIASQNIRITQLETQIKENQEALNQQSLIEQLNAKISLLEVKISEAEKKQIEMNAKIKPSAEFINDLLFIGIKSGNRKLAEFAINIGPDLKAIDAETGKNALSLSLMLNQAGIAEMLRNLEPEIIYYPNRDGHSPIEEALVDNSKSHQLPWLWNAEKKLKVKEEERESDYKKFYDLSNNKESKLFLATDKLWESVKSGNLDGLKSVLDENELNIDVNMLHQDNETLLYKVVYNHSDTSVDMARYLLSKNADYNLKNHSHLVPKVLSEEQSQQLTNGIESIINIDSNLQDAELLKNAAVVKQYSDLSSESAYERACLQKNEKMIKLFSSHAVFNSIRTNDIAAMNSNLSIAEKHSTNILNEFDFNHQTALHLAALNPDPIFMETLLKTIPDKDASLEAKNIEGKTALHIAVERQNEQIVKMLLDKGAGIGEKDNLQQVPLHKAVMNYKANDQSSTTIIESILKKHAECKIHVDILKDSNDKLPSDIAFDNKHSQLAVNIGSLYSKFRAKIKQNNISQAASLVLFTSSSKSNSQMEDKQKDCKDNSVDINDFIPFESFNFIKKF